MQLLYGTGITLLYIMIAVGIVMIARKLIKIGMIILNYWIAQ